jgi:hypothetical protein
MNLLQHEISRFATCRRAMNRPPRSPREGLVETASRSQLWLFKMLTFLQPHFLVSISWIWWPNLFTASEPRILSPQKDQLRPQLPVSAGKLRASDQKCVHEIRGNMPSWFATNTLIFIVFPFPLDDLRDLFFTRKTTIWGNLGTGLSRSHKFSRSWALRGTNRHVVLFPFTISWKSDHRRQKYSNCSMWNS